MRISLKKVLVPTLAAGLILGLSGCGVEAIPGADSFVCVYDRDQKLVKQLPPNSSRERLGEEDVAVNLPASDRFYKVVLDDATRDTLAPKQYDKGFDKERTSLFVQGTTRFKFNLEKACEWYAKHGRRNLGGQETLGFNARGAGEQAQAGWFKFLAENFGEVMNKSIAEVSPAYTWQQLTFTSYAVNANPVTGELPKGETPGESARAKFEREVGERFTKNLETALSGKFFCGTSGEGDCPTIVFEVLVAEPQNPELKKAGENLAALKQQAETAAQAAGIQRTNAAAQAEAERAKQAQLRLEVETARLQAEKDNAKCLPLADRGLACDGSRPSVVIAK